MTGRLTALVFAAAAGAVVLAVWLVPRYGAITTQSAAVVEPALPSLITNPESPKMLRMKTASVAVPVSRPLDFGGGIKRIETPLLIRHQPNPQGLRDEFSIELYRLTDKPNTLLHIRPTDHDKVGFGGGLKLAIEIVEDF